MITATLSMWDGRIFASRKFARGEARALRRWRDRQEFKYGGCLALAISDPEKQVATYIMFARPLEK